MLGLSAAVLSCSDDDGAGTSAGFESIASSVYEEDGDGSVTVMFRDGSVSEDNLIIDGTATEGEDYTITGVSEEGITFQMLDDVAAENIETIRIRIKGASGEANNTHTVRILSDDPGILRIDLDWTGGSDLDLYLYYEDLAGLHNVAFSDPGGPIYVDWTDDDGKYYLSYNYYAGTNDAQAFTATFTPTGVNVNGATTPAVYNGLYTLDNVDPNNIQFEQTFEKEGVNFEISDLEIPVEGSRVGRKTLPNPKH